MDLFAVLLCLLIAFVLNRGMKSAARFETTLVYLKVAVVLLVIVVGAFRIDAGNYAPFAPFGLSAAFAGAATVFFAVFGYDAMSTAAEESRDSQRHMPKAIMYSLGISMVLYVLACLVLTGMVNYRDIDSEAAFSSAFRDVGLPLIGAIVAAGAILGILLAFVVVCIAVVVLRYKQPDLPRTFRTPGMPVVPLVGVGFSLWLISFLEPATWLRFAIWFVIGLVVWLAYGRRHSALAARD